jgi:hypothetical protein
MLRLQLVVLGHCGINNSQGLYCCFRYDQHFIRGGFAGDDVGEQQPEGGVPSTAAVEDAMGRAARTGTIVAGNNRRSAMPQPNDLSRSLATLKPDSTLIAVIEMGQSSWLVAGIVPGIERHPVKKFEPDVDAAPTAAALAGRGGQGRPYRSTEYKLAAR